MAFAAYRIHFVFDITARRNQLFESYLPSRLDNCSLSPVLSVCVHAPLLVCTHSLNLHRTLYPLIWLRASFIWSFFNYFKITQPSVAGHNTHSFISISAWQSPPSIRTQDRRHTPGSFRSTSVFRFFRYTKKIRRSGEKKKNNSVTYPF